ncbi:hypothetical protein DM01DRAFT_1331448 [Hesseltinella vesiculosa]|uniref:Uncharacterized protein n=1 Tax=Hesseltinella vesiculosa TaxID=101127 RepID=A0A1X2GVB9_9FUNG|nr:hypothetical protein DM01DRAFT_1331448 [Hesseltinella vesiculosa]
MATYSETEPMTTNTGEMTSIADPVADELYELAFSMTPGTDESCKKLFRDDAVKDVVVRYLFDNAITGKSYHHGPTEYDEGKRADTVYYPNNNDTNQGLPPIIVEFQLKITHEFIVRAMLYCLYVVKETKKLPMLLVINIDGFCSKKFRMENFSQAESDPFYSMSSILWAKKVMIFNADSISQHLDAPMTHMIALLHMITQQQRNIVALEEYKDKALQYVFKVARDVFESASTDKVLKDTKSASFCDATIKQYEKILKYSNDGEVDRKRVAEYAQDGIRFTKHFKSRCLKPDTATATPMELSKSKDLEYVEEFIASHKGKMNWPACFDLGTQQGRFDRYASYSTLKMAFHRHNL